MGKFGTILALTCFIVSVTPQTDPNVCIRPSDSKRLKCSGRGDCVSGSCQCDILRSGSDKRFTGKYCECNDYSCPYDNQRIFGGNGRCICGTCVCYGGYGGAACEPGAYETCIESNGKTCPDKCAENKFCAMCKAFKTGPYDKVECYHKCENVQLVDKLPTDSGRDRSFLCKFFDPEDDCRFSFSYEYLEGNEISVNVQTTKECPPADAPDVGTKTTAAGFSFVGVVLGVCWWYSCS